MAARRELISGANVVPARTRVEESQELAVSIRHLTDHPILGRLDNHRMGRVARRGNRWNLRHFIDAAGWILAGAVLGSVAILGGMWVLLSI